MARSLPSKPMARTRTVCLLKASSEPKGFVKYLGRAPSIILDTFLLNIQKAVGAVFQQPEAFTDSPMDGGRDRPYETVLPLSQDLGLVINSMIGRDDVQAAANAAKAYPGPGNVLVCWEHGQLAKIAEALGVKRFAKDVDIDHHKKIEYPDTQFNLIWTVVSPYDEIVAVTSEDIPGLDDINNST